MISSTNHDNNTKETTMRTRLRQLVAALMVVATLAAVGSTGKDHGSLNKFIHTGTTIDSGGRHFG